MTSAVYWAILGLVIERPSYGSEIYARYERRYGSLLPVSGASHIYSGLDALRERGLIVALPSAGDVRQPKLEYQATQLGISSYEDRLVEQVDTLGRQLEFWVRQLAVFARTPVSALQILHRFELRHLRDMGGAQSTGRTADLHGNLTDDLVVESRRLLKGNVLAWLQYAKAQFKVIQDREHRDVSS